MKKPFDDEFKDIAGQVVIHPKNELAGFVAVCNREFGITIKPLDRVAFFKYYDFLSKDDENNIHVCCIPLNRFPSCVPAFERFIAAIREVGDYGILPDFVYNSVDVHTGDFEEQRETFAPGVSCSF